MASTLGWIDYDAHERERMNRITATFRVLTVAGDDIVVGFESGRSHCVQIRDTDDVYELHAFVAPAAAVKDVRDLPVRIWRHDRAAQPVSFRIDTRGRVYAEGWVLEDGLEPQEFQLVVGRVAAESDRLEFLLTGRDVE